MNKQKAKNTLFLPFILLCSLFLLANCATPPQKTAQKVKQKTTVQNEIDTELSADELINEAKSSANQESIKYLVQASELYINEQKPAKALWLANRVSPLIEQPELVYRTLVVKLTALLTTMDNSKPENIAIAEDLVAQLNELAKQHQLTHQINYYWQLMKLRELQQQPVLAIAAQLNALAQQQQVLDEQANEVWRQLSQLSKWQLDQLAMLKPEQVKGWLQLSRYARQYGSKNQQLSPHLRRWQQQFPNHSGQHIVAQLQSAPLMLLKSSEQIAVILPLSGKQAPAGNAAQQGILASYQEYKDKQLHFFDSTTLNWQELPALLAQKNIEFIIGPLLRTHVEQFLALETITIPSLLLNLPNNHVLLDHQYALSMRPEDEAIQAAATLAPKGFKYPIVLSHKDSVSQRIAKTFIEHWQNITGQTPEILSFKQGKQMQTDIKASLAVDKSQARIKAIDARVKQTIKADARNRRDIDMVYIVGSPTQTRLLKPYLEVNISPFAEVIPIFASSRSHSAKIDESDTRDLRGLSFTEMPWLLPSKQQNKPLVKLSKQLFPNRSDSLQRIFAMGYDSLALVDVLPVMMQRNYVEHQGQTGTLQLSKDNILTRSLLWGRYEKERVLAIAMD